MTPYLGYCCRPRSNAVMPGSATGSCRRRQVVLPVLAATSPKAPASVRSGASTLAPLRERIGLRALIRHFRLGVNTRLKGVERKPRCHPNPGSLCVRRHLLADYTKPRSPPRWVSGAAEPEGGRQSGMLGRVWNHRIEARETGTPATRTRRATCSTRQTTGSSAQGGDRPGDLSQAVE
jgi:hypothetical protein